MAKHGKKYMAAAAKINADQLYMPADAMKLAKETSFTTFDSTIEVHLRMGLDPRQADQLVRGVVVLPNGLGKKVRVAVFAQGEAATAARTAGASGATSPVCRGERCRSRIGEAIRWLRARNAYAAGGHRWSL